MKVLVIGSGAREHALLWKLCQSPRVRDVYVAPGNGGTSRLGTNVAIPADDHEGLARLAEKEAIDLTIVGPEGPLVGGLVDLFTARGLTAFGPTKSGARIEGSKAWAKRFFERHGIASAPFRVFDNHEKAREWAATRPLPMVVKADGLAAGKGVVVATTRGNALEAVDAIMARREFGAAGDTLVIEDALSGPELSVLVLTDGERALMLPPAQDHKRIGEGDEGPNTGGMGAYAPAPIAARELLDAVRADVVLPTLRGFNAEGITYRGVLFFGLMVTPAGPQVLEVNCRFGDPETEVILPLLVDDFADLAMATARGSLAGWSGGTRPGAAVCVVLASEGYPGAHRTGLPISGLADAEACEGVLVFHAGTKRTPDGSVQTAGGRVLGVTAVGQDIAAAAARAYETAALIAYPGKVYRRDIGARAMGVTRRA